MNLEYKKFSQNETFKGLTFIKLFLSQHGAYTALDRSAPLLSKMSLTDVLFNNAVLDIKLSYQDGLEDYVA